MDDPRQWLQFGGQDMDRAPAGLPIGQAVGTDVAYHAAEGLVDAAKLARQVQSGEVNPMSDEGIERALNAAMVAQMGGFAGAPARAGEAVLGSGPVLKIMDPEERALNLAKAMSRSAIKNNETNEPIRLYHATTQPNLEALKAGGFDPTISGEATWLSPYADKQPAWHNTRGGSNYREGANVMPVYADIQTPLVLDTPEMIDWAQTAFAGGNREFPQYLLPEWRKALVDEGYDGIVYGGPKSKEYALHDLQIGQQPHRDEEILSLFPERQLKSATGNSGEFNMEIPRLSEAHGGEVEAALHAARRHFENGGDAPVIPPEFTSDTAGTPVDFRPLNFDALRQANAVRVTNRANPDGTTDTDPNAGFSIVSGWNDSMAQHGDPRSTVTWPDNPAAYGTVADMFANNPEWITPHKYRQILHSARELGMPDEQIYAPRKAGGGFLSDLFSGPDYLSTGEAASPTNWGDPESAADFFKADRALRLAREVQASEPDRDTPLPPRRPVAEAAPRQQVAAPPPAPATRRIETLPGDTVEPHYFPPALERTIGPYDFGQAVSGQQVTTQMLPHFRESPGFGQVLLNNKTNWADAQPEVPTSNPQRYTMPEAAFVPPAPEAEINNAVSLARETIPSAADALAAVEKLHNAGVYSGEALDKAGEILAAHNRAMFDNIPVEEALRLNRAAGPMMINQGMPREERPAVQPLAYTATPIAAPASAAIDQATGKLTARAPQGPDLNDRQRDLIIRTIAAETSGKTPEESQAIAHVILNRIQSGSYGDSPEAVLFAKNQFEPWSKPGRPNYPMRFSPESRRYGLGQTALDAALGADDITNGATNFWAPKAQAALGRRPPKWGRTGGVDIGETRFHNLSRAEGGLVDDAIHVVREHHADGERVGMDDPRQWLQFGGQDMDRAPAGLPIGQAVGTSAAYHTAEGLADATKLANQVMEGEVDPMSDEGIQRALGAAMVAQTGGLGGAPEGAVLGSGPIRAYHGSPHQFERFDINKIGTGEGAQAYGHGLYLAEHEPTAKFYRDALSDMVVGEKPFNINDPLHKASSILHDEALGDRGRAISIVQNQLARDHDPFNANVLRILKTGKDIPAPVSSGHMYEVNINANPEHFLNWDMPFAGQSKTAQDAIKYAFGPQPGMATFGSRTMDIPRAVHTRLLLDKGIPGIKYLDAESRGMTAKPTHNYVIFNDKLIDINRRYAQGGDVEPASVEDRALMLVSKQA